METKGHVATSAAVGVLTFTAGAAVAWFVIDRRYRREITKVANELQKEFRNMKPRRPRVEYTGQDQKLFNTGVIHRPGPTIEPPDLKEQLKDAVEPEVVKQTIFSNTPSDWDWEQEKQHRSKAEIYIIHQDEYMNQEKDWSQDALTYYEGDQVLVDALDKPIYNHAQFIGYDLRFGHGTEDPNVVYIRNEREQMEYEVIRHTGYYLVEVEGLDIEEEYAEKDLKHSAAPMRFRLE